VNTVDTKSFTYFGFSDGIQEVPIRVGDCVSIVFTFQFVKFGLINWMQH